MKSCPLPSRWKKRTSGSTAISPTASARTIRRPPRCSRACAQEEAGHRRRLIELYQARFGDHIPLIRRQDVKGFVSRKPVWLMRPLPLDAVRKQADSWNWRPQILRKAAARTSDAGIRQLLDDLAEEERSHETAPSNWAATSSTRRAPNRGRDQPAALRAAGRAARARGPDGWLGLYPRAGLRGRVRHPQ